MGSSCTSCLSSSKPILLPEADVSLAAFWNLTTVFLDRDGTINRSAPEGDYITSWSEFEFVPGAPRAIAALSAADLQVVVITNQRGVALGRLSERALSEIHDRMVAELRRAGAEIAGIYYCPHEEGACQCRKPDVGMFLAAQDDLPNVDFRRTVVIGDSWRDIDAARAIQAHSILITGGEKQIDVEAAAELEVSALPEAVNKLLGREQ